MASWMKLLKSLCSPNSMVEDLDVSNGMVIMDDINDEGTAEVVRGAMADLERHHHLNCLRAKGVCRTLSRALAGVPDNSQNDISLHFFLSISISLTKFYFIFRRNFSRKSIKTL